MPCGRGGALPRALFATAFALWISWPRPADASCKTPLPGPELRDLDASADVDPQQAIRNARGMLQRLAATDALQQVELYAIIADAYDTLGDDVEARVAVAAGRHSLAELAPTPAVQDLALRLELVAADAAESEAELDAAVGSLNAWEPRLGSQSLGHACLLLVRGRVQGRLNQQELAARDGLQAYQLAVASGAADARSEAAFQLGTTYRRAGLYEYAKRMADEVVNYARAAGQTAALEGALWEEAQILDEMGEREAALANLAESKQLALQLKDAIGVAFADHERCNTLLALQRIDEAESACLDAEREFRAVGRVDQTASTLDRLAQIDLIRGRPEAALARLSEALSDNGRLAPPTFLPKLYGDLAEVLSRLGRSRDALRALQKSSQLAELADQRRRSLAVALLNAQQEAELHRNERESLRREVLAERERAASRELTRRLAIGLAVAGILLSILIGYLLYTARRHSRELRYRERILRETSDNAPDALVLLDAAGKTRFANRGLFGLSAPPGIDRPLAESVPSAARASIEAAITSLIERRQPVAFDISLAVGDCVRHFDLRGVPIVDGDRLLGATLRASDVTELRTLERQVLDAASKERQRLSSDLHEGLGQELTGISLLLRSAATAAQRGRSDVAALLAEANAQVDRTIRATRDLARGFSPVQIEQGSLSVALERLALDAARRVHVEVTSSAQPSDIRVPETVADHLYRIAYEAVTNAARHSGCQRIVMDLRRDAEGLYLTVTDDGVGFTPAEQLGGSAGLGTKMMAYRARLLGGSLRFEPVAGGGTRVVVSVPVPTVG